MEQDYLKEQRYMRAKKRVKDIKGFYSHLTVYVVINTFLSGFIIYGLSTDGYDFVDAITHFGVYSTWLFWGIGVFFHWLGVFGFKGFIGKNWEERKIKELMDQDEKRSNKTLRR